MSKGTGMTSSGDLSATFVSVEPAIGIPATPIQASRSIIASRARIFLYVSVGIAIFVRLLLTMSTSFPLNDGGMFYVMILNLQSSHYALPHFMSYNDMHIPFAYPPLAFYVTAFLANLTHGSIFTMLRLIPLFLNIAAIGAFALLARSVLRSTDAAAVAVVAFSFLPHSIMWQVMGGGLTRGFGLLFALLALHQGYELFARRVLWRAAPTALFAGLTVLSHPKMAWFLAYSLAFFFFWYGRNRTGLLGASGVVLGTGVLTAPWWGTVIARFGIAPFVASARTGSIPFSELLSDVLHFNITGEPFFPLLALISVLGIAWSIHTRQWALIVWLAIMVPLDSREYLTDMLVPISLFIGIGVVEVLLPWLARIEQSFTPNRKGWITSLVVVGALCFSSLGLITATTSIDGSLSTSDRAAMTWVAQNTPSNSRFVVLSASTWPVDRLGEWFPALTGRVSVATVQGSEWLTVDPFTERLTQFNDLQACADQSTACLDTWTKETGNSFEYVYVFRPPLTNTSSDIHDESTAHHFAIEYALKDDPNYTLVFANSSTAIYKRR